MRKFLKIAIAVGLSAAAVPAAFSCWVWYKTAQVDGFYQERHLLRGMRAAAKKDGGGESKPARDALLQMLPLGTDKVAATDLLRKEGLGCQPTTDISMRQGSIETPGPANNWNDTRTSKEWVDCQVQTQNVVGYDHWVVDLGFDRDGRLSDARVVILYLFL